MVMVFFPMLVMAIRLARSKVLRTAMALVHAAHGRWRCQWLFKSSFPNHRFLTPIRMPRRLMWFFQNLVWKKLHPFGLRWSQVLVDVGWITSWGPPRHRMVAGRHVSTITYISKDWRNSPEMKGSSTISSYLLVFWYCGWLRNPPPWLKPQKSWGSRCRISQPSTENHW